MLDILMPETASAPASARRRYATRTLPLMVGFIGLYALPIAIPLGPAGTVLQLLALACLLVVIAEFVVLMRALDELQFKLHMIALAIAGGGVALLATVFGIAGLALGFGPLDSIFALPAVAIAYYACLFLVSQRYA